MPRRSTWRRAWRPSISTPGPSPGSGDAHLHHTATCVVVLSTAFEEWSTRSPSTRCDGSAHLQQSHCSNWLHRLVQEMVQQQTPYQELQGEADLSALRADLREEVHATLAVVLVGAIGNVAQRGRQVQGVAHALARSPRRPALDISQDRGQDL